MRTYIGLVSKDSDTAFGVHFPDAPGCFSASDSLDDIFVTASEALTDWLALMRQEGHPIPECRDLSELQADQSLADDWASAELVIAVPIQIQTNSAEAA